LRWLQLAELIFVGVGLTGLGLTIEGLRAAREADEVFADSYTSLLPEGSLEQLEEVIGRSVKPLSRGDLEGEGALKLVELARDKRVALLVAGDPFIATTHVALRVEAFKRGVKTSYIPSASIQSVIPGLTGLSSYKFGRSATVVYPDKGLNHAAYEAVRDNQLRGLHTLLYLDLEVERSRAMTISQALQLLLEVEEERREGVIDGEKLVVGVARACWPSCLVKALRVREALSFDFGPPPHVLVFPGSLHFMEVEALKTLASLEV